jgi:pullulanase/glycogen debranching enzyme
MYDKLKLSVLGFDNTSANAIPESEMSLSDLNKIAQYSVFCNSLVFTAQGISFMNAGDEFCRSKVNEDNTLNENSYNATYKCNELDYSRKAANLDTFKDFQNLIKIKNELGAYNYASTAEVTSNTVNLTEANNKTYIDIETTTESGLKVRAIYVSPQVASIDLDLTGYTHYYSSFDQYSASNLSNVNVLGGTTLIVTKA